MAWYSAFAALSLTWVLFRYLRRRWRNPKGLPYPPGPKGYPIIGNMFDMSWTTPWLSVERLGKQYGDIVYLEIFGQPFLLLNSLRTTRDVLEKKSAIYSSRHHMPMILDLMECDYIMAVLPYGAPWKVRRKGFHEHFHGSESLKYQPKQLRQARSLLRRLLKDPDGFEYHARHIFAALIMDVAYGIEVEAENDPYITRAQVIAEAGAEAGTPGAFLVDFFPILKYVPAWFPGASFKRKAAYWATVNRQVRELPLKDTEDRMRRGVAPDSIAKRLIERLPPKSDPSYKEQRSVAEDVTAVAYLGGADTTYSTVLSFFLAMAMHPDVLKRAQDEIDEVVGRDRLPDFGDQDSLPFIRAIAMETLRWLTVVPVGIPHTCIADDEYEGYFIPKGTLVFAGAWSILHDPEVFDEPLEFRPDRYMKDGQFNEEMRSPHTVAFGFGRRICPGRHMSDYSLYAIIASVVAAFDIKPPLDLDGKEIKLTAETTKGAIVYPVTFKCRITPRDAKAEQLIRESSNSSSDTN